RHRGGGFLTLRRQRRRRLLPGRLRPLDHRGRLLQRRPQCLPPPPPSIAPSPSLTLTRPTSEDTGGERGLLRPVPHSPSFLSSPPSRSLLARSFGDAVDAISAPPAELRRPSAISSSSSLFSSSLKLSSLCEMPSGRSCWCWCWCC
uniref:Uncharacterized protein n=1 Tax=Anopheles dirus TaxID=7168 RepID=A0A182NXB8_9DIPT